MGSFKEVIWMGAVHEGTCPNCLSVVAGKKHIDQKQLKEGKGILGFYFQVTVHL